MSADQVKAVQTYTGQDGRQHSFDTSGTCLSDDNCINSITEKKMKARALSVDTSKYSQKPTVRYSTMSFNVASSDVGDTEKNNPTEHVQYSTMAFHADHGDEEDGVRHNSFPNLPSYVPMQQQNTSATASRNNSDFKHSKQSTSRSMRVFSIGDSDQEDISNYSPKPGAAGGTGVETVQYAAMAFPPIRDDNSVEVVVEKSKTPATSLTNNTDIDNDDTNTLTVTAVVEETPVQYSSMLFNKSNDSQKDSLSTDSALTDSALTDSTLTDSHNSTVQYSTIAFNPQSGSNLPATQDLSAHNISGSNSSHFASLPKDATSAIQSTPFGAKVNYSSENFAQFSGTPKPIKKRERKPRLRGKEPWLTQSMSSGNGLQTL